MKAKDAAEGRGVWVDDQMTDGTRSIRIEADTLDATAFDHTLDQIAGALGGLGDPDVNDVRRAKAVGVIADPQGALDLLSGDAKNSGEASNRDDAARGLAAAPPTSAAGTAAGAGLGSPVRRPGSGGRRSPCTCTCTRTRSPAVSVSGGSRGSDR